MPQLKTLSANEVLSFLQKEGFEINRQHGSHIVLVRQLTGFRQVLTVPNHKNIDRGTLKAIFNQSKKFINEEDLRRYFYTE